MDKTIRKYTKLYKNALKEKQFRNIDKKASAYAKRLKKMYLSKAYKQHNIYV